MPTYEYECDQCGYRFERFQRMSDRSIKRCPRCSGAVRRLIGTGSAILFKGREVHDANHATNRGSPGPRCDRTRPCCGREQPCDTPPCQE